MSINLKEDHPVLYKRVWRKVLVHLALGLSLLLSPPIPAPQTTVTVVIQSIGLKLAGSIFLFIGLIIAIGMLYKTGNYRIARIGLAIATGHAMMWLLALTLTVFTGDLRSGTILVLWAYLTSNLFEVTTDTGWTTIQVLDTIRDSRDGE